MRRFGEQYIQSSHELFRHMWHLWQWTYDCSNIARHVELQDRTPEQSGQEPRNSMITHRFFGYYLYSEKLTLPRIFSFHLLRATSSAYLKPTQYNMPIVRFKMWYFLQSNSASAFSDSCLWWQKCMPRGRGGGRRWKRGTIQIQI